MARRKKHNTPKHLDYLFDRRVISKAQYRDFWEGYWGESGQRAKNSYVDQFVLDLESTTEPEEVQSGTITNSIEHAREQAKKIGGYVVRRNKQGRFSKTGKQFQAVVRRKKK